MIRSILSYFNPFSSQYNAIELFNKKDNLSTEKKVGICVSSFFAGLFTFGFGGIALFRYLVGRFSKIPPDSSQEITNSTTKVAHKVIGNQQTPNTQNIDNPKSEVKTITEAISILQQEKGISINGQAEDSWHEIVFDSHPYRKQEVHCNWKIHVSPSSHTPLVLDTIKPVLLKRRPFCKIVQSDEKLKDLENSKDLNGKKVYKGKFITIYPKTNEEALLLAQELHEAFQTAQLSPNDATVPCTDRPLGNSGYLWARNDLAGGPIDQMQYHDATHAHAIPGNYNTTIILPMEAYDKNPGPEYDTWYASNYHSFERIEHKDIFENDFGATQWTGSPESEDGKFTSLPPQR